MTYTPLLSIIIPIFNTELYLNECLDSVINQINEEIELILVNDGSTDGSDRICEEYKKKYKNILVIDQINKGLSEARNIGLKYAKGKFVSFLDSDDMVDERYISLLNEFINSYSYKNIDVLYFSAEVKLEVEIKIFDNPYERILVKDTISGLDYLDRVYPLFYISSACLGFYRREFLMDFNIIFPPGVYYEDNVFTLKVLINAKKIKVTNEKIYIRRHRKESIMTGKTTLKKCFDIVSVSRLMWKELGDISGYQKIKEKCYVYNFIKTVEKLALYNQQQDIHNLYISFANSYLMTNSSFNCDNMCRMIANMVAYRILGDRKSEKIMKDEASAILKKKMLPLGLEKKENKVAIYGIGNSTKGFIKLYKEIVGDINSQIYFVISGYSESSFMGMNVVNIKDVFDDTLIYILPSLYYENTMKRMLQKKGIDCNKVASLYDEGDCLDYSTIEKIYNYGGK